MPEPEIIAVAGATGLQGGAVARRLIEQGWRVRALTRKAASRKAQALAALGAEIVQGDMNEKSSLYPLLEGAHGLYSVQNPFLGGPEQEIRQGRNIADVAKDVGIAHVVYGSAGTGAPGTGVPSWETKLEVERHMKELGLPLTILRPMAFMELMTDSKFFPPATAWHLMPAMMGSSRKVVWLCTEDLAAVAAKAFSDPGSFIGKDLRLASDVQSLDECRLIYREVMGKGPRRIPMPEWLFSRFGFVGRDLTTMWRKLATMEIDLDTSPTLAIHPDALTVRSWLSKRAPAARDATP
jgi:uncharacterized protein YbjT (DUF2867 family)